MSRNMLAMFASPSRSARQQSPRSSPVRELARALRRPCSPKPTSQYQTMKEPIISKTRLTMTGGFHDLRPQSPYDIFDDDDSLNGVFPTSRSSTPSPNSYQEQHRGSIPSLVRSDSTTSCGSLSPVLKRSAKNDIFKDRRLVKVPRNAFQSFLQTLSPRISKKIFNNATERPPSQPIWPTVTDTYARGISRSNIEKLVTPNEPSLTAMRASAALEEKRNFREALRALVEKVDQHREADYASDSEDEENGCSDYYSCGYGEQPNAPKLPRKNQSAAHRDSSRHYPRELHPRTPSPYPADLLYLGQEINNVPFSFLEEPLSMALGDIDIDSVPTLEVEELKNGNLAEVRNVHVTCDYIILETGPPADQYTV